MSYKKKTDFFAPYSFLYQRSLGTNSATQTKLIRNRFQRVKNLYRRDLRAHFGCVNAIEFSHGDGDWIVSGGDDRRVLLWNVQKAMDNYGKALCMKGEHHSNIFCLAFGTDNKKIFSGGNDEQVIVHDSTTGETLDVFLHEDAVYGLSADPVNDNVFATACDDGRVLIYDMRAPSDEDPFCLANYTSPMHAVMFNPVEPRLVATANSREGLGLWDVRKPRSCLIRYGGSLSQQSCMSVRINRTGDRVIGLRRRLPPVLYNLQSTQTVYQFDHSGYYNSCTMKSCCFAGDKDQYVISGSDDFNLYVWKIPEEGCSDWVGDAHLVLRGHRSIVNQVRFNPSNHLIISSGVEKVIKMWSPFPLVEGSGDLGLCPDTDERSVYTHEQYINLVLRTGQFMTHDYTNESTEEDPRMMAFFDSLVQRELEGWSSEDSLSSHSPIRDDYVHSGSDNSLRSSPVTAEEVQSITTDAILRFFSPTNSINSNRRTGPVEASTPANTSLSEENRVEARGRDDSRQEARTILDMDDQNVPTVVNRESNDAPSSSSSSSSSNSLMTNVENGYTPDASQHEYSRDRNISEHSRRNGNFNNDDDGIEQLQDIRGHSNANEENVSVREGVAGENNNPGEVPSMAGTSADAEHDGTNRVASYKSISELIEQKRKDYLTSIKKLEKRAIRRKMKFLSRRKEKLKRIRLRLLPSMGDDRLSTSDSDDIDEDIDDFKEAQFSSDGTSSSDDSSSHTASTSKDECSSSPNHSSPCNSQAVVDEIVEKRKQLLNRVQKFKKLRTRVLNSDSSDSDSHQENIPELSKDSNSLSKNGQSKNGCSSSLIPLPVYEDISNDSCQADIVNGQNESSNIRLDFTNSVNGNDLVMCNHTDDETHKCDTTNGANKSKCSSHEVLQSEVKSVHNDKLETDKICQGNNANSNTSQVTNGTMSDIVNSSSVTQNDPSQEKTFDHNSKKTTFTKIKSKVKSSKRNYRRKDTDKSD